MMARSMVIPKKADTAAKPRGSPAGPSSLKLLTVREAAAYAKVSEQTIRRWIKDGRLKIYRAGRQIRIDEKDLIDLLSSSELKWL